MSTTMLKALLASLALVGSEARVQAELPITTTDVFIQSGDVTSSSAVINARCNSEQPSSAKLVVTGNGVMFKDVDSDTDYTMNFLVEGLKSNREYKYFVQCKSSGAVTKSRFGTFKTLPKEDEESEMKFVWVADLAGQGWGRNPDLEIETVDGTTIKGGYVMFDVMSKLKPDFAVFQGDMIYADNNIPPEKEINAAVGGGIWVNNPSKDFTANTLDEFRKNWVYNFGDEKMQDFLAKTPVYATWDDHEVTNNWYPGEFTSDPRYAQVNGQVDLLFERSLQAFKEYNPLDPTREEIYRNVKFGKHLEIFFPDFRSYRGPNTDNTIPGLLDMMGQEQLEWLLDGLENSDATWKILSFHDPISIVTGGPNDYDSFGQNECPIQGRENELSQLFDLIRDENIQNVVSITTDVHYTAAYLLEPNLECSGTDDYKPMFEFVVGPTHAGAFGPNNLDPSFNPTMPALYERGPGTFGLPGNLPPPFYQSFGYAQVSKEGVLTVKLVDITGEILYATTLAPEN